MKENRDKIARLDILCGSRFLQFTAQFVRKYSGFEDKMRIYTEPEAFEAELSRVVHAN